jgi:hypothetical protein
VVNWRASASTILPVEDLHRARGGDVSKQNPKQGKAMQRVQAQRYVLRVKNLRTSFGPFFSDEQIRVVAESKE